MQLGLLGGDGNGGGLLQLRDIHIICIALRHGGNGAGEASAEARDPSASEARMERSKHWKDARARKRAETTHADR